MNTDPQPSTLNSHPLVYAYTRAQAVADGFPIEVSKVAAEAGIRFPVFLTRTVYDAYVTVPPGVTNGPCGSHQDEAGRLWDIVWMLRFAIRRARLAPRPWERERVAEGRVRDEGLARMPFALYVRNDNHRARLVKLIATCGPLDLDDPQPAITVMMPHED